MLSSPLNTDKLTDEQTKLWKEEFGKHYARRNAITEIDIQNRQCMWQLILECIITTTKQVPESYLEVGAGQGINLLALYNMYATNNKKVELTGIEVNRETCEILNSHTKNILVINNDWKTMDTTKYSADVVFTSGVLIHTHKDDLDNVMGKMFKSSKKHIVCVEYFSPTRREIEYRGAYNQLWSDDYGSMWLDKFPVRCVGYGFMWKRASGLDDLTYWIFEKTN